MATPLYRQHVPPGHAAGYAAGLFGPLLSVGAFQMSRRPRARLLLLSVSDLGGFSEVRSRVTDSSHRQCTSSNVPPRRSPRRPAHVGSRVGARAARADQDLNDGRTDDDWAPDAVRRRHADDRKRARDARPPARQRPRPLLSRQTPVVKISEKMCPPGVTMYAKCEYFNPLSSVKDRLALAIIQVRACS